VAETSQGSTPQTPGGQAPSVSQPTKEVYAIYTGDIDQKNVPRLVSAVTLCSGDGTTHLHVQFQSWGGFVGDGIFLYNLFRVLPFELHLYNSGAVASAAVLAYLGARRRKASAHAEFMIHLSSRSQPSTTAASLKSLAESLSLDDSRTEAILREHIKLPEARWSEFKYHDIRFSGAQAVEVGLAQEVAEFAPPEGTRLYNL
jgi:ATP-dependent Clp protease protease subunit